jgi:hypothetical protein
MLQCAKENSLIVPMKGYKIHVYGATPCMATLLKYKKFKRELTNRAPYLRVERT